MQKQAIIGVKQVFFILFFLVQMSAWAQETALSGVYQGHNLYIRNPYIAETDKFCIESVSINKREVVDIDLRLSAIQIDFQKIDLYAPVLVKIQHGDSCKPRFINPEAILFHSNFKFDSLEITDSLITWHTKGDKRAGLYTVEKLQDEYWEEVSTIRSKGEFEGADYVYFPLYDEGGNKYRIKYSIPEEGRFLYSEELELFHFNEPITFSPKSVTDKLTLSRHSDFEILDADGKTILSGSGRVIPLRRLKKGDYTIYLEGYTDTFIKK